MDDRSGHIISDIEGIDPKRREFYRKLEGSEADLAREFLAGRASGTIDISGDSDLAKIARAERALGAEQVMDRAARRRLIKQLAKA